jgi:hypothetical protein
MNMTGLIRFTISVIAAAVLLPSLPLAVSAQADTVSLEDENIDIVKDFEPVVQRANKKHFVPELPEISTKKPFFDDYALQVRYSDVNYTPSEIKPLSFPKEELPELPFAYLKAGFGNYLTPLVDFQLANKHTEKFRLGAGLEHLSSRRKKIENQRFAETDAKIMGEAYFKGMTLGAEPYFQLHNYHFYGYDQEDTSFTADETRNRYTGGGLEIYLFNHEHNDLGLDYHTTIGLHSLKDGYSNKEFGFDWDIDLSVKFREIIRVGGAMFMNLSSLKSVMNDNRFAVGFNPYFEAGRDRWWVRGGAWILVDDGTFYALPDIRHQSKLFKNFIVIYNEWKGHLEFSNLRTLSAENPFLSGNISYNNYRVEERNFVGFKGHVPIGIDYDARFSQIVYYDMPLFVNDTSVFRSFNLSYDKKIKTWNGHVSLGYQYADFLNIKASFDYFKYNPKDNAEAWHLPSFRTSLSANYHFDNKLILQADIFAFSGIKVQGADGSVEKLKGTVDLNFSANYHLNRYVAFFAQVNNAISLKHKRFNHYPGYGFLVLGGVILSY